MPAGDPSAFFDAMGIAETAKARVGGWEYPKLRVDTATASGEPSALGWMTRLNDDELAKIDQYIIPEEQAALAAALGALEELGPVLGIQLCGDDGSGKLVMTLARRPSGNRVGLLAGRALDSASTISAACLTLLPLPCRVRP